MRQWGGRFKESPSDLMMKFSVSLHYDKRLYEYDIRGSKAHVKMLAGQGIINEDEADRLIRGLDKVLESFRAGKIPDDPRLEDIHTAVEHVLKEHVGDLAGKVHTGRSRNDQVALDMHMWCKDAVQELVVSVRELQKAFVLKAIKYGNAVMPGYTHLQRAQPVLAGHHLMSYYFMLERDMKRLNMCYDSADCSPLGAAALAGSTFLLDPKATQKELGFARIYDNSMDAVSNRDFMLEMLFACSVIMTHLSRFAEEVILWTTPEFGFARLSDSVTTGSSIMPQKKNADAAELTRGRAGTIYGKLMALFTTIKGLPLTYCRDLQEDKQGLFQAYDITKMCVEMTGEMVRGLEFDCQVLEQAASDWMLMATDIADYLASKGMPFREAHEVVGGLVRFCTENNMSPQQLTVEQLKAISHLFDETFFGMLKPDHSVRARNYPMCTGPDSFSDQVKKAIKTLGI